MSATIAGIKGLAQLSGSFALAGLVTSHSRTSRTAHAFYVDPALVVFKDAPYPIKKASGTLVTPDGPKVYPVEQQLKSPWSSFHPGYMYIIWLKNAGLQAAFYLQRYVAQVDALESEAKERARLEGRDEEDADEIALPPIPLEDVRDLALASSRSTVRECGVTHIRRRLELRLHGQVSDGLLWKLCKDVSRSTLRKAHRHQRFWQISYATFCTVQRAYLLGQIAEWTLSTTLDGLWVHDDDCASSAKVGVLADLWDPIHRFFKCVVILGVPLLPPQWQVKLGEKRPERPPAQIAHLEQALPQVFPEVDPAGQRPQGPDAREPSGSGRSAGAPMEENLPALQPIAWGMRLKKVAKKAAGNALRVTASLLAFSTGAAAAAALYPKGALVMVAANAADFALSYFLTGNELYDWYEHGRIPVHTLAIASASLGITIHLMQKARKAES